MRSILWDFSGTIYDFREEKLVKGIDTILPKLSTYANHIISTGTNDRISILDRYNIKQFFSSLLFVPRKNIDLYKPFPKDSIVIGDRIRREITFGNELGMTTIWLKRGFFADEAPEKKEEQPDHIITALEQIGQILL